MSSAAAFGDDADIHLRKRRGVQNTKNTETITETPTPIESTIRDTSVSDHSGSARNSISSRNSDQWLFFVYASLAGTCGALSGVVGKIAVTSSVISRIIAQALPASASTSSEDAEAQWMRVAIIAAVPWVLRIVFFLANAVLTGQMWRYYIKALALGPTPVCQIINTGTNFAVSAFVGLILFGEEVNWMWASGALLVVCGLALVVTDPITKTQ